MRQFSITLGRNCHASAREFFGAGAIASVIEELTDFAEPWRMISVVENHAEFPRRILDERPSAVGMTGRKQFDEHGVECIVHDEPDAAGFRLVAPSQSRDQKASSVLAFAVIRLKSSLCHDANICAVHAVALARLRLRMQRVCLRSPTSFIARLVGKMNSLVRK